MRLAILVLCGLLFTARAWAADVYVFQGLASGPNLNSEFAVLWTTDAFFYNTGDTPATITLVHATPSSTASRVPVGDTFTLPPHRGASLVKAKPSWAGVDGLAVLHLESPPEVVVDDALFIGETPLHVSGIPSPFTFGKARLPVFRSLTPPGVQQIHLATSLGPAGDVSPTIAVLPNRINVTIYNDAQVSANATIEIRQHCDDRVLSSRSVTIVADSIVQIGPFDTATVNCQDSSGLGDSERMVYTVVTVDQPSFSFVSNLSNAATPTTSISITGTP